MKISTILLGMFCLFFFHSFSQEQESVYVKVEYEFTHVTDTTQPDNPIKQNYVLYVGKTMSKYSDLYNAMYDEGKPFTTTGTDERGSIKKTVRMGLDRSMFKKVALGRCYWETPFPGKIFEVEDTLPKISWKITREVKNIKGHKCQKATAFWKGRNYNAWFCPGFPYNTGPWKFTGLPGLILEIADNRNEVGWTVVKIGDNGKDLGTIAMKKGAAIVTQAEFTKLETAMRKDAMAMRGASGIAHPNVRVDAVPMSSIMPGAEGKNKIRGYNNPIEKVK